MDSNDRQPAGISITDRGQTTQDFAVGIGIFILTVAFVFGFLATFITPFSGPVGPAESAQAERIASTVVDDLEDSEKANNLDETPGGYVPYNTNLESELGLRSVSGSRFDNVNISVESVNQTEGQIDPSYDTGDYYSDGQTAESAARIVTIDDSALTNSNHCDPACRIVVRIW